MRVVPKSCTPTLKWFGNYGLLCASFEIEVMMYKPKSKKLNEFFCSPFIKGCEVLHFIIWMKNSSTDAMCMKKVIYTNFSLTQRGSIELIYIVWYFQFFPFLVVIDVDVVIDIILFCVFVFWICLFFTERHVIFSKILLGYIWMETPPFSKKQLIKNVCNLR